MSAPAEIAAKLTKAQREAMLSYAWDTGMAGAWHGKRLSWYSRAGLAAYSLEKGWHLTPLGLLVRAELEKEKRDD